MPKAKCIKAFSSPRHGNRSSGDTIEDTHELLIQFRDAGLVEYEPEKKEPDPGDGKAIPLSSSQAGQVQPNSNSTTLNSEELQAEIDKAAESEQSQSTAAIDSEKPTLSTDATIAGGPDTKKKPGKKGKNAGQ